MIESTNNKVVYVVADNPVFAFPIRFFAPNDIHCYLYADNNETELVRGTDFTVEYKDDYSSGANVTLLGTLVPGSKLAIARVTPMTQDVNLPEYGKLPSAAVETQLDKIVMICQELARELARCLKISDYDGQRGKEFLAPLYSPDFFGIPTAPTAPQTTSTNQIATTEFAKTAVDHHNSWENAHFNMLLTYVPPGTVMPYAGPGGHLPLLVRFLYCDGSAVSRTVYADLFAAIGTTYGAGDGSTTFTLPDLRGRFLRGWQEGVTEPVGTPQAESLPDIRGAYIASEQNNDFSVLGITPGGNNINAFHVWGTLPNSRCGDQNASGPAVAFRASYYDPIYGGSHVTPANYAVHYIIKY